MTEAQRLRTLKQKSLRLAHKHLAEAKDELMKTGEQLPAREIGRVMRIINERLDWLATGGEVT